MRIGVSLLLVAVGAILKFAVTTAVSGVNLATIGVILMLIGVVGLVISLAMMNTRRRTDVIHHRDGTTLIAPGEPIEPIDRRY
jgi:hypothetical protein